MKKSISIIITIFIFIIIILFFVTPKNKFSYSENRYLAKFPKLNVDNIMSGKFMINLNDYISDHFPLREKMLSFKTKVYKNVGVKKQSDIYYGKDNKLYQEYKKPINSDFIVKRVNKFKSSVNSKVSFMLVPTSIYVYSDKVSKYSTSYDEEKTINYFKNNLKTDFIDVREALIKNKNSYIYYGTDHHWTTRGAGIAYQEFCNYKGLKCNNYNYNTVNKKFYGTLYSKLLDNSLKYDYIEKIDDNTEYKVYFDDTQKTTNSLYNYDYLNKKDKYSFFLDNNHSLIKIENKNVDNNNSILIIKDSYANAFIPFICPHYKYIYIIDPRYYSLSITKFTNENNIKDVLFLYNVLTIDDDIGIVSIK